MSALVRYEEMRVAVERCARIDEAADIRDKAAALSAYARQRDDAELAVWTQEIKLRASVRIGELVRELDTADQGGAGGGSTVPDAGMSKRDAIEEAGLSKSDAYRYQELAGPREDQAQKAASAAAERYFAQSRADKKPATMEGLRGVVRDAVVATVGPKKKREPIVYDPPKTDEVEDPWPHVAMDFVAFIKGVAETAFRPDGYVPTKTKVRAIYLRQAQEAAVKLNYWIALLEEVDAQAAA